MGRWIVMMAAVVVVLAAGRARGATTSVPGEDGFVYGLKEAEVVYKVRVGEIPGMEERLKGWRGIEGVRFEVKCEVLSAVKGRAWKEVSLSFKVGANGEHLTEWEMRPGEVYLVMLRGGQEPYEVFAAIPAEAGAVRWQFGEGVEDRLLAELVAAAGSKDAVTRQEALEQIGLFGDVRGIEAAEAAAKEKGAEISRAGMVAMYRLGVVPDAKRVVEVLDGQMVEALNRLTDRQRVDILRNPRMAWAVKGFDYAVLLREGMGKEFVRKDAEVRGQLLGLISRAAPKGCVPEVVALLDDADAGIQRWAAGFLRKVVEPGVGREDLTEAGMAEEAARWRAWWKEKGDAYMGAGKPG